MMMLKVRRYLSDTHVSNLPSSLDDLALPRLPLVQFSVRSALAFMFVIPVLNSTIIFPVSHQCMDCNRLRPTTEPSPS